MSVSLSLSDLISDVRNLIGSGPYDVLFNQDMTTKAINFACSTVAEMLELTRVDVVTTVASNQCAQPGDAVKLLGLIDVVTLGGVTVANPILESTLEIEDRKNPNWRFRTGEPSIYVEYSGNTILFNGQPASGYVLIGYIQEPTQMINLTDTPDSRIKDFFHQYLRFGAAAWLLKQAGQGQNIKKSREYFADFVAGIRGPEMAEEDE